MTQPHETYSRLNQRNTDAGAPAGEHAVTVENLHVSAAGDSRKPYHAPVLQTYGTVKALTQGAGSFSGDGGSMRNMAAMMMSDARTKDIVAKVGQHPAGFGLYLFHYKPGMASEAEAGLKFGVLAQEVAMHVPDSVVSGANGFLHVDYASLGISLS